MLRLKKSFCETMNRLVPPDRPRAVFKDGKCVNEKGSGPEHFFGLMASQSNPGFSVMKVKYKNAIAYDVTTELGTDIGMCHTVVTYTDFEGRLLPTDRFDIWRNTPAGAVSGKVKGSYTYNSFSVRES